MLSKKFAAPVPPFLDAAVKVVVDTSAEASVVAFHEGGGYAQSISDWKQSHHIEIRAEFCGGVCHNQKQRLEDKLADIYSSGGS